MNEWIQWAWIITTRVCKHVDYIIGKQSKILK